MGRRWSGTYAFVEARVRCLVADLLGVGIGQLAPDVSLTDDLAADSIDLVELAIALEAEFGIVVPERILDRVRTYGDLLDATLTLILQRLEAEPRGAETPPLIWARVLPRVGKRGGSLERVGRLTPYVAETITEDALWAGAGAQLEVTVAADTPAADVARVRDQFGRLGPRGVRVDVRCGQGPEACVDPADTVPAARPEQLRFPFRAGPRSVVREGMSGGGAAEEGAAHEYRPVDQGLRHGPQPARQGRERGEQSRVVPGDRESSPRAR